MKTKTNKVNHLPDSFNMADWESNAFDEHTKVCTELKNTILDCWDWLEPKPKESILFGRARLEELVENQEELINALRKILEPIVDKIKEAENE